jgi:hypothetical protein
MTQEQLSQVFDDIRAHGRKVEGWHCEELGDGHALVDLKRGGRWERKTPNDAWTAIS